jgi:hypothetical protein
MRAHAEVRRGKKRGYYKEVNTKRLLSQAEARELIARYTVVAPSPFDNDGGDQLLDGGGNMRELACANCGKFRTTCRNTLKDHILSELNFYLFQCPVCDKLFRQKGYLNRHIRTHSDKEVRSRGGDNKSSAPQLTDDEHMMMNGDMEPDENGDVDQQDVSAASGRLDMTQAEMYGQESEIIAEDITKGKDLSYFKV